MREITGLWIPVVILLIPIATIGVVSSPAFRLVFVVGAGMFAFQSSEGLSAIKILYSLGVVVAITIALWRLKRLRRTDAHALLRPVMVSSAVFAVFIVAESVLAAVSGASAAMVVRDAGSYLFFCVVPLLALDARQIGDAKFIPRFFICFGLVGTLLYALSFADRRGGGIAEVSVGISTGLPLALTCYVSAAALLGKRFLPWAAAMGGLLGVALMTGNRIALVSTLFGVLAIALFAGRGRVKRALRLATAVPVVIVLAVSAMGLAANALRVDSVAMQQRFDTLLGRTPIIADQSFVQRRSQTELTREVFLDHPFLGVGPGYIFVWSDASAHVVYATNQLDSPLQYPAKFGLIGVALLALVCFRYGALTGRLLREPDIPRAALLGFLVSQLTSALLQAPPIDSKGMMLALIPLLAMALPQPTLDQPTRAFERGGVLAS